MITTTQCPYCMHRQRYDMDFSQHNYSYKQPDVITCDVDDGGCDRDYVVYFSIRVIQETHTLTRENQREVA